MFGRKAKWMFITVLAPELLLGLSIFAFALARETLAAAKLQAEQDGVPWSMAHSFFAHIGTFALVFDEDPVTTRGADDDDGAETLALGLPIQADTDSTTVPEVSGGSWNGPVSSSGLCKVAEVADAEDYDPRHATKSNSQEKQPSQPVDRRKVETREEHASQVEDFRDETKHSLSRRLCGDTPPRLHRRHITLLRDLDENEPAFFQHFQARREHLRRHIWILNTDALLYVRGAGIVERLPLFSEEDIADRSKSDVAVKILAVFQILWLVGQLIERAVSGTPSTPLEISTVAFSFCAIVIYALLFDVPKDVATHHYIKASRDIRDWQELKELACTMPITEGDAKRPELMTESFRDNVSISIGLTLGGTVFGGLHLLGWNLVYPNNIQTQMWRASALITTLVPPFSFAYGLLIQKAERAAQPTHKKLADLLGKTYHYTSIILIPIYISARAFLLVESFLSLYYQPPEVFLASPADNAPHAG